MSPEILSIKNCNQNERVVLILGGFSWELSRMRFNRHWQSGETEPKESNIPGWDI